MAGPLEQKCKDCIYWTEETSLKEFEDVEGTCRYYPPAVGRGIFPTTSGELDWCRLFDDGKDEFGNPRH